jgi:hypothetical protein
MLLGLAYLCDLDRLHREGSVGILAVYSICYVNYIMHSYSLCGQIIMMRYVD